MKIYLVLRVDILGSFFEIINIEVRRGSRTYSRASVALFDYGLLERRSKDGKSKVNATVNRKQFSKVYCFIYKRIMIY